MGVSAAFFARVSDAVFANPFSAKREAFDHALARELGMPAGGFGSQLVPGLETRLAQARDDPDYARLSDTTRAHLDHAALFICFHLFSDAIDAHIDAQLASPATALEFAPARDIVDACVARGVEAARAEGYLPIFFQMRRAFRFIDTGLTGEGPSARRLREALWNNLFTRHLGVYDTWLRERMEDFSTILLGPTGAGKSSAAVALGRAGYIPYDRKKRRFVESFAAGLSSINLSAYPPTLIESELFGHEKGAFTGAVTKHEGVFARCAAHGACFLDEIGDVGTELQTKLLMVLETRRFSPVGSHETRAFRGRLIAATHRDLDALRAAGKFRDDFYYRLCSDVIEVPSLRTRLDENAAELDRLVEQILARTLGRPAPELVAGTVRSIVDGVGRDYTWPGNVRELEQAVRRVLLTGTYTGDRRPRGEGPLAGISAAMAEHSLTARELTAAYAAAAYTRLGSYEAVASALDLDRRTVRKYVLAAREVETRPAAP